MLFPSISDYKEAIALSESFATLTYLTPEKGLFGDVYFSSGNFAVVFKMRDSRTGKLHAVKCFTREQERRTESLGQISAYLKTLKSPFIVPYTFLNEGIWVNDAEYPVLLMDWVEGVTLGEKVKTLCDARDTEGLHRLSVAFADMALALLAQDWAHGDLKHDNIIVRPDNTLALVDYDWCFVPSMSGQNAREIGSPCYRHPKRTAQHFDRHIDDFSILVIFLSLRALVNAPELMTQHHNGENLVLTTADFGNAAPLLTALRDKNEPILRGSVALLEFALAMPSGQVFGLKEGVLMPFFEKNKKILVRKVVLVFEREHFKPLVMEVDRDITELNLRSKWITSLPKEIGQLINLKSLNLDENQLKSLPAEIGQLTNLTSLCLTRNRLTSLPKEIGQLTNLKSLELFPSQLTSLPKEIGQLTNLTKLGLSSSKLTSLPKEIEQLANLTKLNLSGNQLTSLPKEIGQLTNLTELELWHNKLTSLPKEIGQLTNLTSLSLPVNQLTRLPSEIGQLTNLTSLNLSVNQLTHLPEQIGQLTNLTRLYLNSNPLISLPAEIGQLTNLTKLHLSTIKLTSLPREIGQLTNLTELSLSCNRLTSLPREIGQLTNLRLCYLRDNLLSQIEQEKIKQLLPNCDIRF
jgi:Leucine-rich repeat (LRR) protein